MINKVHRENFEKCFVQQYSMIHRLETNKLRNVAKFFAHLLGTSALPWHVLPNIYKYSFPVELKKQSSCSVQLVNNSYSYVAFKVKTTSPKRYCVRPNTGVILPKSTFDFTVTLQAYRSAPPDMQLKDKFLVQSTAVPLGTTDDDINVPNFFSKELRVIEEHKLRVVLVSPLNSPVLQPINGGSKQEPSYNSPVLKESPPTKDQVFSGPENLQPSHIAKDVEDLKLKLGCLEMKLSETDKTITMLREEKGLAIQERDKLQKETIMLRQKCAARVQAGFPFLFVVFIAIVSGWFGHLLHL